MQVLITTASAVDDKKVVAYKEILCWGSDSRSELSEGFCGGFG